MPNSGTAAGNTFDRDINLPRPREELRLIQAPISGEHFIIADALYRKRCFGEHCS